MKRIRDRVGGLDVHRDTVVACARVVDPDGSVHVTKQSFSTTSNGLGELATFLSDAAVDTVAMEATGVHHVLLRALKDGGEYLFLVCKVGVERPGRAVGFLGDVGKPCVEIARPLEDGPRRLDQGRAGPRPAPSGGRYPQQSGGRATALHARPGPPRALSYPSLDRT